MKSVYKFIKKIPIIGNIFLKFKNFINSPKKYSVKDEHFKRVKVNEKYEFQENELIRISNLLNYTKISGSSYSASKYPAGYHSFEIFGQTLIGQRNPKKRFSNLNINFEGKRVLDIGSNQGGMLFFLRDKIELGVGIDYDPRMTNVANRIANAINKNNLQFYVFDLENEPLELITDFIPGGKVDIIFLLSVCMWVENWRSVIAYSSKLTNQMIFESNGTKEQQLKQEKEIKKYYSKVILISDQSDDDPHQKNRRLFLCEEPTK